MRVCWIPKNDEPLPKLIHNYYVRVTEHQVEHVCVCVADLYAIMHAPACFCSRPCSSPCPSLLAFLVMCLPPVASPALESAFACMTWDYDSFECEELYDTKTHKIGNEKLFWTFRMQ